MADDKRNAVARHDPGLSRDDLLEQIHRRVRLFDAVRQSLPDRPGNLVSFANQAHALAGLSHLATPDTPEIMSYLRMMARAIAAAAARAIPGGGPVRVDLGKLGPIEIPPAQQLPIPLLQHRNGGASGAADQDRRTAEGLASRHKELRNRQKTQRHIQGRLHYQEGFR